MTEKTKDWSQIRKDIAQEEQDSLLDTDDMDIEDLEEAPVSGADRALEHPSYAELTEKLTLAEQEAFENLDKAKRAMAELKNVQYRAEQDILKANRYGQEKLITALLPVIDSLEQALQLAISHHSMHEGLDLTLKLFKDVLAKYHVTQLDPIGELFNPQEHEAMSMQMITDVVPNTIVTVVQKGYKLNDRVIRPARVIVAKEPA